MRTPFFIFTLFLFRLLFRARLIPVARFLFSQVHIDTPVGHRMRREEGIPLLNEKFVRHVSQYFSKEKADE